VDDHRCGCVSLIVILLDEYVWKNILPLFWLTKSINF
jgi:hypothetical protein